MIFKKAADPQEACIRVRILAWLAIISWLIFIVALVVFHYGRPEQSYGVLQYFGIIVRADWIPDLRHWYQSLLRICCGLSLVSLLVNHSRVKTKNRVRFNTVLLLLVTLTLLLISYLANK
jgi:hypothetical protein